MPGSTTNRGYPYPLESDAGPDAADAITDLATAVDIDVQSLADDVVPLDTAGTNITASNPGDTKQAGTSGEAADAGHRHAREAAPKADFTITFHIANVLTTGLKDPGWIAPANCTLKFAYGRTKAGTGAKYQIWVEDAAPAGMVDSPATGNTVSVKHDFTDVNVDEGQIVRVNVTNAGSSASSLSATIDGIWR